MSKKPFDISLSKIFDDQRILFNVERETGTDLNASFCGGDLRLMLFKVKLIHSFSHTRGRLWDNGVFRVKDRSRNTADPSMGASRDWSG
jgi:hypothetical protein